MIILQIIFTSSIVLIRAQERVINRLCFSHSENCVSLFLINVYDSELPNKWLSMCVYIHISGWVIHCLSCILMLTLIRFIFFYYYFHISRGIQLNVMSLDCNAATEGWDRRITVTSRSILATYWLLSQKQQHGNTLSPKKGPTHKHTCISLLKQMWKFKKKHLHFNWRRFRFQYWSYRAMRNGQWSSFSDPVSSLLIQ